MKEETDKIPAWIMAQDILTKLKDELVNRAMLILENEIKNKRVDFKGKLVVDSDKSDENEKYLFMINHLIEDQKKIHETYDSYIEESENITDPKQLEKIDNLKKFILAVDSISMLMAYSKQMDDWVIDASFSINDEDPSNIIYNTALNSEERKEIIKFVLANPDFKNEILHKDEFELLKNTYDKLNNEEKESE